MDESLGKNLGKKNEISQKGRECLESNNLSPYRIMGQASLTTHLPWNYSNIEGRASEKGYRSTPS